MSRRVFSIPFIAVVLMTSAILSPLYAQNSTLRLSETATQVPASPNSPFVEIEHCGVHLIDDIDVPAREAGLLLAVNVLEGQVVTKGSLLAQIDDQLARRQLEEAQLRYDIANDKANDPSEVNVAQRKVDLTSIEFESAVKLYRQDSKSKFEHDRAKYSKEVSELELIKVQRDKKLAAAEAQAEMVKVNAATDSIHRHQLVCPLDGHVFEVHKQAGEWVNAGETVLRVARMDKLKTKGLIYASMYDPNEIADRPVTVQVRLARDRVIELPGRVINVGLEIEGTGNQYAVWAEVDNKLENGQWILHAKESVSMKVHLQ